jgi:beta-glucosidase
MRPLAPVAAGVVVTLVSLPGQARADARRVDRLLARMTEPEKVRLLHTASDHCNRPGADCRGKWFSVRGVPRLGIPDLHFADGSAGVATKGKPATAMPAPVALAATFDPAAARLYGATIAREARAIGADVLQAPMVNLVRVPIAGRNFETFGEDPQLAAALAAAEVRGIQGEGVMAMVKHFVANDFEYRRSGVDVRIGERTLQEGELVAFRSAIQAGAAAVMCALPRINGVHVCAKPALIRALLEGKWGFRGFVRSDYQATHRTSDLLAGLDMEAPRPVHFTDTALLAAVAHGTRGVPARRWRAAVDRAVRRILREMDRFHLLGHPPPPPPPPSTWRADDAHLAEQIAVAGATLLRDRHGALPLQPAGLRHGSVLVTGTPALRPAAGIGSSHVVPFPGSAAPLQALEALSGRPNAFRYVPGTDVHRVVAAAHHASTAIVFAYDVAGEKHDRPSLALPDGQDGLIDAVARANRHTIVVLNTGAPVTMPWLKRVDAVLELWYPGQEAGRATARVLLGQDDPGGRLPVTFPTDWRHQPAASPVRYPGVQLPGRRYLTMRYGDGVLFGYRWYDQHRERPLFPFGAGLSYTRFAYSGLRVATLPDRVLVRFRVTNTGQRPGTDVPQLYLGRPARPPVSMAPRSLCDFQRISLPAGASADVTLTAGAQDLSYWSAQRHDWVRAPLAGRTVAVGASSRDLRLSASL